METLFEELTLLSAIHPDGVSVETLCESGHWSPDQIVSLMNSLSNKVDFITSGSSLLFKPKLDIEIKQTEHMDVNHKIIYSIIKAAGNKGIWIKDIKAKSQIHSQITTTTIKSLEKNKIIKSIKPVKNSTRKVYMLYHIQPSTDVTGGPWYTDSEFDSAFVDALAAQCFKYILAKSNPPKGTIFPSSYTGYPTTRRVLKHIKSSRLFHVELSLTDIQQVVDRLVFDDKVYCMIKYTAKTDDDEDDADEHEDRDEDEEDDDEDVDTDYVPAQSMYVASKAYPSDNAFTGLTGAPCGKCPVISFCCDGGPVNPANCEYYQEWLSVW